MSVQRSPDSDTGHFSPRPTVSRHGLGSGRPSPGSEVERIEEVGHFFLVEKPAEMNDRILRFLGKKP